MPKVLSLLPQIVALEGHENYDDWTISMQAFLEHQNLWKAVVAPTGGATTVDEETLRKARTEILLSVSKNVRIQIKNENSVESMWKKLKTLYDPDTSCKKN